MISPNFIDGVGCDATRRHKKAPAETPAATPAKLSFRPNGYMIVQDSGTKLVLAVLIPRDVDETTLMAAEQHCYGSHMQESRQLKDAWNLRAVFGRKHWIDLMLAMGNPPMPRVVHVFLVSQR